MTKFLQFKVIRVSYQRYTCIVNLAIITSLSFKVIFYNSAATNLLSAKSWEYCLQITVRSHQIVVTKNRPCLFYFLLFYFIFLTKSQIRLAIMSGLTLIIVTLQLFNEDPPWSFFCYEIQVKILRKRLLFICTHHRMKQHALGHILCC